MTKVYLDHASVVTFILYSRQVQRQIEVFLRLDLRKQYHRILQEVLLYIDDACLIDFQPFSVFKKIVKSITNF